MNETEALWWQPNGWLPAIAQFDTHLSSLERRGATLPSDAPLASLQRASGVLPLMLPAPVDLHVFGGGGFDLTAGTEALRGVLETHAAAGTGALLATVPLTADVDACLGSIAEVMAEPREQEAALLGAHLDGSETATTPDRALFERFFETGLVKVLSLSPGADPDGRLYALCEAHAVRLQLARSGGSDQDSQRLLAEGAGVSRLFHGMPIVSAQGGGLAAAALGMAGHASIVAGGEEVDALAFLAALRAIPALYLVSAAEAPAALPDGRHELRGRSLSKRGVALRDDDGSYRGSALTQTASLAWLKALGLDWHAMATLSSARPAHWINAVGHGLIRKGAQANWLEVQDDVIAARWLGGQRRPG